MRRSRRAVVLLASAPVAALLSTAPPRAPGPPAPGPGHLAAPILSVRRVPTWVDDTLAAQRLTGSLRSITAGVGGPNEPAACVVVDQGSGTLYSLNPTQELIPASNLKLLTSTAVLDVLGPDHRLTTTVESAGAPRGGVLRGNLYLVGGGDPYLRTTAYNSRLLFPDPTYTSLDHLAELVRAAGVSSVTGSVVGDASRYDSLIGVATWKPIYLTEGDVGPLSALEVNDGSPPPAGLPGSPPAPAGPPATATPPPAPPEPTLYAAQTFTEALEAAGVKVAGPAATGRAPAGALTVAKVDSAPSSTVVDQMLRVSDDTAAELLTKELGRHETGEGTTAAGAAAIAKDLAADGLPAGQATLLDGSGLDRGDRATCSLVTAVLERAGTTGVIAAGLPVAGRTGTLSDRMTGTVAAGRLHAKTGTLDGVTSLSGFSDPRPSAPTPELGTPVYFSIIINGMDSGLAAQLADRLGVAIATYPDAVPLSVLEPGG